METMVCMVLKTTGITRQRGRMHCYTICLHTLVLISTTTVECQQKANGNPASGNAMDLALMTMNMMGHNSNCVIQPCQSVCQTLNQTSGCYVCSSSCNSGSGSGINAPLNPHVQMPIGGGCDSSWIQCPISCTRRYVYGCLKCDCSTLTHRTTHAMLPMITKGATKNVSYPSIHQTHVGTVGLPATFTPTSKTPVDQPRITQDMLPITPDTITPSPTSSVSIPMINMSSTQSANTITVSPLTASNPSPVIKLNPPIKVASSSNVREYDISTELYQPDDPATNLNEATKLENILIFVLSTCLVISITITSVLLVVWRRSVRKLRRNKNELYFIQKSNHQELKARIQNNAFDMNEPIYARIETTPEVPPRSPPLTPISPISATSLELLLRTESVSSDTSVQQIEECRHDYLELI